MIRFYDLINNIFVGKATYTWLLFPIETIDYRDRVLLFNFIQWCGTKSWESKKNK